MVAALAAPQYQFPRDHFEHPEYKTEWWYYTGNVADAKGRRYGFELVFFRQWGDPNSTGTWGRQQIYLAHAALASADSFHYDERLNRAGPDVAGASFEKQRVWNGNWSVQWNGLRQSLECVTGKFRFHLELEPVKPAVIHGVNGISAGAHYVSFPRLRVTGNVEGQAVSGQAWMDHEWFTVLGAAAGWDWFSVQLENNTELMLFQLKDGSGEGTYIDAAGVAHHLTRDAFTLQPLEMWKTYPVRWRVRVPSLGIDMECTALRRDQQLIGSPTYWEGAVTYRGTHRGVGYLEMTGR